MMLIKRLLRLLSKRDKFILIILLIASIVVSFLETFGLSLIMLFASVATNFDLVNKNKYFNYVYRLSGCSSVYKFVIIFGFCLIFFFIFRGIVLALFTYFQSYFSQTRFKYFSTKFFKNYLHFKYQDFTSANSSNINKVIFADAGQLTQILFAFLVIAAESLTMFCIYCSLLVVNWKMTIVLTLVLSFIVFLIIKIFSAKLTKEGKRSQKFNVELARNFNESFANFKLIKLLSNQNIFLDKYSKSATGMVKANTINVMLQNSPRILLETIGFSLLILVLIYVIFTSHTANFIIPTISMYAFAFYRFLPSVNKLISSYNQILFSKQAIDSVESYYSYELENLGSDKIIFNKSIEFKEVFFNYNQKNQILNNVSLTINKGQATAFMGSSGAGKSTIVDIIMGLYKPQSGNIKIDGVKLDNNNLQYWRSMIGYIPQNIYLFDGTVADNIVFGRPFDEQKVIKSLIKANIYDFLLTQDGIYTKVGEAGVKISGGQKQRIAIARALYDDPVVLVLDEATSALDNEIEAKIMDEIYSLNKDKTLIIVAHRLSTIARCEKIYKIENGKVELVESLVNHNNLNIKKEEVLT